MAATGEEGFFLVETEHFELLILDVMLPGRSGLEILAALRRRGMHTPVLLLTARDSVDDRVQGLDAGGDDYLVKPFAFSELLARVRALLRPGTQENQKVFQLADLALDAEPRQVTRGGQPLDLTAREFELLEYLLRNQGRVVSRDVSVRRFESVVVSAASSGAAASTFTVSVALPGLRVMVSAARCATSRRTCWTSLLNPATSTVTS